MTGARSILCFVVLATGAFALAACSDAGAGQATADSEGASDGGGAPPGSGAGDGSGAVADGAVSAGPDATVADSGSAAADSSSDAAPAPSGPRVVAYLPNYSGSYADWAKSIDFHTMTHLNLAFATANANSDWDLGAPASDVNALVAAAHAKGVKVLASLGGGGGDQSVIAQFKNSANVPKLVDNLAALVAAEKLDGVDVDIEDPNHLGADYTVFVDAVIKKLRPQGKLVTAAVAQYLQGGMQDATLRAFDFVNVMIYSSYADSVAAMTFYTHDKGLPNDRVTLGAGFFGTDSGGNEYAYKDIVAADANAWSKDQAQVNGNTVSYTGMASMKKLADYAKGFGGIMFWELSEDTTDAHSLYKVIQSAN